MRSVDVIDSELRLLVAVRRAVVAEGGSAPSVRLLDERPAFDQSGD